MRNWRRRLSAGVVLALVCNCRFENGLGLPRLISNVGSDRNWSGSHFNQANWYVFGRMAWDPDLAARAVAEDWIRQTFSNDPNVIAPVLEMMMTSREAVVSYMTPLGLAHLRRAGTLRAGARRLGGHHLGGVRDRLPFAA